MTKSKTNSESFKENYQKLKKIADTLSSEEDVDIDALVPMVDEGLAAYKVCSERIASVNTMLEERLQETAEE